MQTYINEKAAMLFIGDALAMLLAAIISIAFGHQAPFSFGLVSSYQWSFLTLAAATFVVFFILDLYSLRELPEIYLHQIPIMFIGLAISAFVVSLIFFFLRNPVPRAVFILFFCFSAVMIIVFRLFFHRMTLSSIYWKILVIGDVKPSLELAHIVNSRKYLHSRVIGYLSCEDVPGKPGDIPCLGTMHDIFSVIDRHRIDQVVVTTCETRHDLNSLLLKCLKRKIKITDYRRLMEDVSGKVPIDYLDDHWFISLSNLDKRYFWIAKRSFDIAFGLVGFLLASPVLVLAMLLIKLDSKGPVLYSQQRIGRDSRPFRVWKLRTMVNGADKDSVHWTLDNDDRITRVGRLLRKMHIDELPQIFNILIGDMSLIGPRPEASSLVERYMREIPYYPERDMVTPGITGWAQINHCYGNSIEDTRQKLMYDFYYIKNRSIALDLTIFLRTIRTVLTGKGAL